METIFRDEISGHLLRDALGEVSEHFGATPRNPISISLLCIDLGISEDERGKLMIAFRMLLKEPLDDLSEGEIIALFRASIMECLSVAEDEFAVDIIIGLITGFAKSYIPELYAVAMLLQDYQE